MKRSFANSALVLAATMAVLAQACSSGSQSSNGVVTETGPGDARLAREAGPLDARVARDASSPKEDSTTAPDAGPSKDAGVDAVDASDAGASDAGASDADAYVAAGPCGLGVIPPGAQQVALSTISLQAFADAIATAKTYLSQNPTATYVLTLGAGTFDLADQVLGNAAFDVSGIQPTSAGRLIVTGAGSASTTLVLAAFEPPTYGAGAAHVCFVGMHFSKAHYTVSQGHVVSSTSEGMVLDIQSGFPTPAALYNDAGQGYLLRQYTDSPSNPQLLGQYDGGDKQIMWGNPTLVDGGYWALSTQAPSQWEAGSLIGIKAEPGPLPDAGTGPGGGGGDFTDSDDIVFNDIQWTDVSRMAFTRTNAVQILNSSIVRSPPIQGQTPCLATAGGGPQIIGGKVDGGTSGHVIANFFVDSTGDDPIAFYQGAKGVVLHSRLSNSFSKRCINSDPTASVTVDDYTRSHAANCMLVLPDAGN